MRVAVGGPRGPATIPRRRRALGLALFDQVLERGDVFRHLLACLAPDHEGYQELADAVAGEVHADRQPGAGVGEWLDLDVDGGPDRAVSALDAPRAGRVDVR